MEKKNGAPFEVDLEMTKDINTACATDNIADTINYNDVFKKVEKTMTQTSYNLIEALADRIAGEIFDAYQLEQITVRVRKPKAPIDGKLDTVEVEITKEKSK